MDEVLVDTNILVYAYQPAEIAKYSRAVDVVETLTQNARGRLSAQVLAEFVNATTRKKEPLLSFDDAHRVVMLFIRSFVVLAVTEFVILEALRGARDHQMSYYDAQIWATAKLHQIPTILTEDFTDGRVIEGVRFVNPFLH